MAAGFLVFPVMVFGALIIVAVRLVYWTATYVVPVVGGLYLTSGVDTGAQMCIIGDEQWGRVTWTTQSPSRRSPAKQVGSRMQKTCRSHCSHF